MEDLLTWQGVRALASGEAMNLGDQCALVQMDLTRPPIKWYHQRHYFETAAPWTSAPGAILYARTAWRHPWRDQLVQIVADPTVLVTTFYDPTIKPPAVQTVLADTSPIRHWFGVQAMARHPRLTPMPVGVEGSIVPLLEAGERRATRDIRLYLNFNISHPYQLTEHIRPTLWRHFRAQSWVTAHPWQPGAEAEYVVNLGRSQFVLSPPGYGWDCYRTYEAIAMGAIPIVQRRPPATDVCEDLPVLLVNSWQEVTEDRLRHEWETQRVMARQTETMTMTYWRNVIQQTAEAVKEQSIGAHATR